LLPALIILEVDVLRERSDLTYLFILMDLVIVAFIALEIFITIRRWRKEVKIIEGEDNIENENEGKMEINKEWNKEEEEEKQIA
jgi:hypothetical protein